MIIIIAKNIVKPENKAAFIAIAQPLIEASRTESGNISYDLFEEIGNPNALTFIERWRDEAAIETHNSSEHFTSIVPKLGELGTGEKNVTLYKPAE